MSKRDKKYQVAYMKTLADVQNSKTHKKTFDSLKEANEWIRENKGKYVAMFRYLLKKRVK